MKQILNVNNHLCMFPRETKLSCKRCDDCNGTVENMFIHVQNIHDEMFIQDLFSSELQTIRCNMCEVTELRLPDVGDLIWLSNCGIISTCENCGAGSIFGDPQKSCIDDKHVKCHVLAVLLKSSKLSTGEGVVTSVKVLKTLKCLNADLRCRASFNTNMKNIKSPSKIILYETDNVKTTKIKSSFAHVNSKM